MITRVIIVSTFGVLPEAFGPGFREQMRCRVEVAEWATFDPASAGSQDAVVFLAELESLLGTERNRVERVGTALRGLAETLAKLKKAGVQLSVVSTFPISRESTPYETHDPEGIPAAIVRANTALFRLSAERAGLYLFDFGAWVSHFGARRAFESRNGRAFTPAASHALGTALYRFVTAAGRTPAKVLALDLDNVLWAGTLDEDGVAGVRIDERHQMLQRFVYDLKRRGVLLALVSKNDESIVRDAFAQRKADLHLSFDDFVAHRINWSRKSKNLSSIAEELNLGLESFVFVDDSAVERAEVASALPQVCVYGDHDIDGTLRSLLSAVELDTLRVTNEDLARSASYAARAARVRMRDDFAGNAAEFLQALETKVTIVPVGESEIERALQLLQKTNQFNVTTRRHNQLQFRALLKRAGTIAVMMGVSDRFGDCGLVGLAIAKADGKKIAELDTFLLSCRVIGRGVEDVLWAKMLERCAQRGFQEVRVEYLPTERNHQVADLFDRFGCTPVRSRGEAKRYVVALPRVHDLPAWITVHG